MSLDWIITLIAMAFGAGLMALAVWQSGRKRPDSLKVRWIPWRFVTLFIAAVMALGLVHIVNLLGFHTGRAGY